MNEPALNQPMPVPAPVPTNPLPATLDPGALELRDIHLPDAVSWWPIAPGWWILLAGLLLIIAVIIISRKIYKKKQLKRDIRAELENIKQQFYQSDDKAHLARSLSVLLRRAGISYYPNTDIAGLIGNDWLIFLDKTNGNSSADKNFQSNIGKVLLTAPYLPDDSNFEFEAQTLIRVCETWLRSTHKSARTSQDKKTSDTVPGVASS